MKVNVLHITPDFNYACGRSYYVFLLLKYLKRSGHNVLLVTNGGDSTDRLVENDIPYICSHKLMSKNPFIFSNTIGLLKDFVKKNDINIIHTHHRYCELIALKVARSFRNRKIRTIFTSLSIVKRKYNIEYRSNRIIAVNNTMKNMLKERFRINEERISVIPNFVDTEELVDSKVLSVQSQHPAELINLLSIGRFHPDKNFRLLLRAFRLLNNPRMKLTLIGDGPEDIDYKKYISAYNLKAEVLPPKKDLRKYFYMADLCVLPSLRDPFPNFMLQCGLHNKPFIGAKVDGIAELIKPGVNGLLFESKNYKELASNIKRLIEDKQLAVECSNNLHKLVMTAYTQENVIPQIELTYKQILGN